MNDPYGIGAFLSPLAFWLIVAVVVEVVVFHRSRETNTWLPATFFVVTMFRLYWIGWITTLRIRDATGNFDTETAREKLLISMFVFFVGAVFIPAAVMMFHHAWSRRQKCGMLRTVVRLIPCCGVTYLFVAHFMLATRFIARINPYA
jgi:hypothetical protein